MPIGLIVPDASAWVELLRRTGSSTDLRLLELIEQPTTLVTVDPVVMEVLAGARSTSEQSRLTALLGRCRYAAVESPHDFVRAAEVYRVCRAAGHGVRSQLDCLIAAIAMRIGAAVLHADTDFDVIARHAPLRIA
jgi:hypothetical protein